VTGLVKVSGPSCRTTWLERARGFQPRGPETGRTSRARVAPADRESVRRFLARFGGAELEVALEAKTRMPYEHSSPPSRPCARIPLISCAPRQTTAQFSTALVLAPLFEVSVVAVHVPENGATVPTQLASAAGLEFRESAGSTIELIVSATDSSEVAAQPAGHTALEVITRVSRPVVVVPPHARPPDAAHPDSRTSRRAQPVRSRCVARLKFVL
jgi:hypothetical protein